MGSTPILAISKNKMLLTNRTSFITGASKGIGSQIARTFAKEGSNIAFTYLSNFFEGEKLEKELNSMGIFAKGYKLDVSNFKSSELVINDILNTFGNLDILVNNAGIINDNILLRMNEDAWNNVININLKSVFNTVKSSIKNFIKKKYGSIINISSIVGLKGGFGQSNYSASKSGIIGFTKSIALELGSRNIRSNVIMPGLINTSMTNFFIKNNKNFITSLIPLKRIGTMQDIANCALFLASDRSNYITGQVIGVDGGILT